MAESELRELIKYYIWRGELMFDGAIKCANVYKVSFAGGDSGLSVGV